MAQRSDINRLAAKADCVETTVIRWLRGGPVRGTTRVALERIAKELGIDSAGLSHLRSLVALPAEESADEADTQPAGPPSGIGSEEPKDGAA